MFIRSRKIGPLLTVVWAAMAATLLPDAALGQEGRVSVFDGITGHLAPSTMTFEQTTVNLPGSHLRSDTVAYSFEANIHPHFTLFRAPVEGPLPGAYMLNVAGQFLLRRSDGVPSNPVRTPSYIPSGTLFYSPTDSTESNKGYWYLSVALSHYSNGEIGNVLQADGTLNNVDGSFSLWSVAAGIHFDNEWPLLPAYKALQVEYIYGKEGALDALYPDYVVSLKLHTADYPVPGWGGAGRTRLHMDADWRVRKQSSFPDSRKPVPLSGSVTGIYTPEWKGQALFPDMSLFARYYAGSDYYNMNFDQEIYRIDFGLMLGLR
jgi:hypothetical protein